MNDRGGDPDLDSVRRKDSPALHTAGDVHQKQNENDELKIPGSRETDIAVCEHNDHQTAQHQKREIVLCKKHSEVFW